MLRHLLFTTLLLAVAAPAAAYDLSQHLWRDRLLILAADDPQDAELADGFRAVEEQRLGVDDRRLRVFRLFARSGWVDDRPLSAGDVAHLRRAFGIASGQRELILVGLDGDIKRRADLATALSEVFEQIDAMPMRRAELRTRQESPGAAQ